MPSYFFVIAVSLLIGFARLAIPGHDVFNLEGTIVAVLLILLGASLTIWAGPLLYRDDTSAPTDHRVVAALLLVAVYAVLPCLTCVFGWPVVYEGLSHLWIGQLFGTMGTPLRKTAVWCLVLLTALEGIMFVTGGFAVHGF